jgi:AhpD family alkylhydroperoxidase
MDYPEHYGHVMALMKELGESSPAMMKAFMRLHGATVKDGVLSGKTKELIALAIGINVRCDGCIAYHVHDAVAAGASREEVIETIGVAIMMGGGPSVIYGAEALEALDQFEPAVA